MAEKKVQMDKKIAVTADVYDVLRRPIVSEKAVKLSEAGSVAFEIAPCATKQDVARAIQAIYNVKPTKINIVVVKGKVKQFRGRSSGTQKTVKKAYVSLPADTKLDFATNL